LIEAKYLGNTRIWFTHNTDFEISSTDPIVLQYTDYYAYGLPYAQSKFDEALQTRDNKYQYNGIELIDDFGLHANHALFRTLDPQLGRWWQVDPKAEAFYGWSGYNSNLDNPILNKDPEGDICVPCLTAIGGGLIAGAVEFGTQLAAAGGDIRKVDFIDVTASTLEGAAVGSGIPWLATAGVAVSESIKAGADYTD
jgi:RHS repeat-associated protein